MMQIRIGIVLIFRLLFWRCSPRFVQLYGKIVLNNIAMIIAEVRSVIQSLVYISSSPLDNSAYLFSRLLALSICVMECVPHRLLETSRTRVQKGLL